MTDKIEARLHEIEQRYKFGPWDTQTVWRDVPTLCKALRRAVRTLESNAVPRLGGKQQQYEAQAALPDIARILSGEEGQ